MAIADKFKFSQALISAVALEDSADGLPASQKGTGNAGWVIPPSEMPGAPTYTLIRDLTTTRQSVSYPSGAKALVVSYRLLPGATAVTNQFARIVVNAMSDADANGKLATDGAYQAICQGDDVLIPAQPADPITRIDVISSQAVGAEKTLMYITASV